MAARHQRFPVGAFVELAVADHDDNAVVFLAVARSERIADRDRQAMAERASGNLDLRALLAVGVHAELVGIQAFKVLYHVVLRIGALIGEDRIQGFRAMALGQDEAVAALLVRVHDVKVQVFVIQRDRHLHNGQLAAQMAHTDAVNKIQQIAPDIDALVLQLRNRQQLFLAHLQDPPCYSPSNRLHRMTIFGYLPLRCAANACSQSSISKICSGFVNALKSISGSISAVRSKLKCVQ